MPRRVCSTVVEKGGPEEDSSLASHLPSSQPRKDQACGISSLMGNGMYLLMTRPSPPSRGTDRA